MCHIKWTVGTWADTLLIQEIIEVNQQLNKRKSKLYLPIQWLSAENPSLLDFTIENKNSSLQSPIAWSLSRLSQSKKLFTPVINFGHFPTRRKQMQAVGTYHRSNPASVAEMSDSEWPWWGDLNLNAIPTPKPQQILVINFLVSNSYVHFFCDGPCILYPSSPP